MRIFFGKNSPIKVPLNPTRAKYDYDCGPTSIRGIYKFHDKNYDHFYFIDICNTRRKYGTTINGMLKAIKEIEYKSKYFEDMSISELKNQLRLRRPVICLISAWNTGHYVVAIGYDKDNFYFMDSGLWNSIGFIPKKEFEERWYAIGWDNKLHKRIGISVWKPGKKNKQKKVSKSVKFIPQ